MVGRAALLRRRGRAAARPYLEMRPHLLLKCSRAIYGGTGFGETRGGGGVYFSADSRPVPVTSLVANSGPVQPVTWMPLRTALLTCCREMPLAQVPLMFSSTRP